MRVRRVPFLDEYAEGGESAVLVGDRVKLELSPRDLTRGRIVGVVR